MKEIMSLKIDENFCDMITNAYRHCAWYNESIESAKRKMRRDFPDIDDEIIEDIIYGRKKFTLNKDCETMNIVNDNWEIPDWQKITEMLMAMKYNKSYFYTKFKLKSFQTGDLEEEVDNIYDYFYEDKKIVHENMSKLLTKILNRVRLNQGLISSKYAFMDEEELKEKFKGILPSDFSLNTNYEVSVAKRENEGIIKGFNEIPTNPIPISCAEFRDTRNGWLSPKGELYVCQHFGHDNLAFDLNEKGTSQLEKIGWIRLAEREWLSYGKFGEYKPTDEQIETIEKWQEANNNKSFVWNGVPYFHENWLKRISEDFS